MMVGHIEEYGERFGVEPICAVLPIAPSTEAGQAHGVLFYAFRPVSTVANANDPA